MSALPHFSDVDLLGYSKRKVCCRWQGWTVRDLPGVQSLEPRSDRPDMFRAKRRLGSGDLGIRDPSWPVAR